MTDRVPLPGVRRVKIWLEPVPGVGEKAVATKTWYGYKVIGRGLVDRKCYAVCFFGKQDFIPRV